MGLSNISFGMPQRPYLNGQFLTMALASGLTTPIMNPLNYAAKKAFVSSSTLLGWDPGSAEFIKDTATKTKQQRQAMRLQKVQIKHPLIATTH